jgi:hypothetical protein
VTKALFKNGAPINKSERHSGVNAYAVIIILCFDSCSDDFLEIVASIKNVLVKGNVAYKTHCKIAQGMARPTVSVVCSNGQRFQI